LEEGVGVDAGDRGGRLQCDGPLLSCRRAAAAALPRDLRVEESPPSVPCAAKPTAVQNLARQGAHPVRACGQTRRGVESVELGRQNMPPCVAPRTRSAKACYSPHLLCGERLVSVLLPQALAPSRLHAPGPCGSRGCPQRHTRLADRAEILVCGQAAFPLGVRQRQVRFVPKAEQLVHLLLAHALFRPRSWL